MLGDPSEVQEFRPKRRVAGMGLMFLACLGFVWAGVWMVQTAKNEHDGIVGLLCLAAFVFAGIFMLWRIVSPRTLVFSPAGLEFCTFGRRKRVAWSNIASTTIRRYRSDATNALWLKDPTAVDGFDDGGGEGFFRFVNVKLGAGHIALSWVDRDRGAEAFDELLKAWIGRYGRSAD